MTSGSIIFINRKSTYQENFPLIQPLSPLRKDYFHQNNIDLHVEIIHCIQAIRRHWSREPITTLSAPSMCICLDLSGRITTPDRFSYHTSQVHSGTMKRPGNEKIMLFCSFKKLKVIKYLQY